MSQEAKTQSEVWRQHPLTEIMLVFYAIYSRGGCGLGTGIAAIRCRAAAAGCDPTSPARARGANLTLGAGGPHPPFRTRDQGHRQPVEKLNRLICNLLI
jgi:hypothetical protein